MQYRRAIDNFDKKDFLLLKLFLILSLVAFGVISLFGNDN